MSSVSKSIINTFYKITESLPRANAIIFEATPIYSDNTYWFFKYLVENTDVADRYTFVWILKDRKDFRDELCGKKIKCILREPETVKEKLEHIYYTAFAKFIIDCNGYVKKKNKKQIRIFLGHGMPLKIVKSYDLKKGEVDMNMITTYNFNRHFYDIGDTDENMRNFGYCRTDVLANNKGKRKNQSPKYIIWMPTYRQHSNASDLRMEKSFPLGLPVIKSHEEMKEINKCLQENSVILYLRPHPVQDISVMHLDEMSNIIIADSNYVNSKGLQLYEFLTQTDALITDYSSVYYDYLMLDRPIALAIEDFEDFNKKWDMYYNTIESFKENYKCPYIYTVDDLKQFIKDVATDNDKYEAERENARNKFYDYPDNKVCERIYNFMVEEYGL